MMVNKEKLFAAFDEWDSASYRPHSESSIRYNPDSVVLGKWPLRWAAFRSRLLGRTFVSSTLPLLPPRLPCQSWCRWSQADGCSTGINVC